jgi:hypothetical protein
MFDLAPSPSSAPVRVEPEQGDLWMTVAGGAAAKAHLREGFETTDLLPLPVATRSVVDVSRRAAVDDASVDALARRLNDPDLR